jgi:hypothetical protein
MGGCARSKMVLFMGDVLEDTEQQIFIVMFVARMNFVCSVYLVLQIKYFLLQL